MDLSFNGLTSLNTTLHALKNLPTLSNLLLIGNPLFVSSNGIFFFIIRRNYIALTSCVAKMKWDILLQTT